MDNGRQEMGAIYDVVIKVRSLKMPKVPVLRNHSSVRASRWNFPRGMPLGYDDLPNFPGLHLGQSETMHTQSVQGTQASMSCHHTNQFTVLCNGTSRQGD
jgi:hypothetical protein